MLNVRLNKDIEKKLADYSQQMNLSKTDVVKEALAMYFRKDQTDLSPYDLGADLFGVAGSGDANSSKSYKAKLKEKLNEKHSH